MLKQLLEMVWRTLRLVEDNQQNRQDLKALEKRLFDFAIATDAENQRLKHANETLVFEVQRLNAEFARQREREEAERRILKLELENRLLRQERGLPPAPSGTPLVPQADAPKQDDLDAKD